MSEAVSAVSDAASNEIAVAAGKVFGSILSVALLILPIVLLYFLIVNFRKLLIEIREKKEADAAEARTAEERKRQLDEMESEESDEEILKKDGHDEEETPEESQGE